jgi:hypothetical protein
MISGITIAKNMLSYGFPYDLAIRSFAQVCDEIVVVIPRSDTPTFNALHKLMAELEDECMIKIRGVLNPDSFDVFRFIGYMFTDKPDWVVHFDLDYLISPANADKMRLEIENAPSDLDAISYNLVYLSRTAKNVVYNKDMAKWVPPYNGIQGTYPFIINPRKHVFISPFEGVTESGRYVNFEGLISLGDKWGESVFLKYDNGQHNFNIKDSGISVEHLSFSLNIESLRSKLQHEYWRELGFGEEYVINGGSEYEVSYPLLEEARKRYV